MATASQKGCWGKPMTAINLCALLARSSRRVLLIDMDPQGHATLGVIKDPIHLEKTVYEVLAGEGGLMGLREVVIKIRDNFDIAPSDVLLSALPEKLRDMPEKENRLSAAFEQICEDYDYLVIDCPPPR